MSQPNPVRGKRLITAAILVAFLIPLALLTRKYLSFDQVLLWEEQLLHSVATRPLQTAGLASVIYIIVTGLSLPGASFLSLLYAWLLPFPVALTVASLSSTAGATISFLLSRFLFSEQVRGRFPIRAQVFDQKFDRDGWLFLLTLRMVPAFPFFLVNILMGLTRIPLRTYVIVSWLGMLPVTVVYIFAGSQVPTLAQLANTSLSELISREVFIALALLASFPWLVRAVLSRFTSDGKNQQVDLTES